MLFNLLPLAMDPSLAQRQRPLPRTILTPVISSQDVTKGQDGQPLHDPTVGGFESGRASQRAWEQGSEMPQPVKLALASPFFRTESLDSVDDTAIDTDDDTYSDCEDDEPVRPRCLPEKKPGIFKRRPINQPRNASMNSGLLTVELRGVPPLSNPVPAKEIRRQLIKKELGEDLRKHVLRERRQTHPTANAYL